MEVLTFLPFKPGSHPLCSCPLNTLQFLTEEEVCSPCANPCLRALFSLSSFSQVLCAAFILYKFFTWDSFSPSPLPLISLNDSPVKIVATKATRSLARSFPFLYHGFYPSHVLLLLPPNVLFCSYPLHTLTPDRFKSPSIQPGWFLNHSYFYLF